MSSPNEQDLVTPAQIRAARALLGWTQSQLSRAARVGLSTIKDIEVGKRAPIANNDLSIRKTLEDGGVIFISDDSSRGGPGVRLRSNRPEIIRRPFRIQTRNTLAFLVAAQNQRILVQLPTEVLSQLDGSQLESLADYLAAFRRHEQAILEASGRAIAQKQFSDPGFVDLTAVDFQSRG